MFSYRVTQFKMLPMHVKFTLLQNVQIDLPVLKNITSNYEEVATNATKYNFLPMLSPEHKNSDTTTRQNSTRLQYGIHTLKQISLSPDNGMYN